MDQEVILALLSFAGTLAGSLAGIFATQRLSNYRIEQLEKKVDSLENRLNKIYTTTIAILATVVTSLLVIVL